VTAAREVSRTLKSPSSPRATASAPRARAATPTGCTGSGANSRCQRAVQRCGT